MTSDPPTEVSESTFRRVESLYLTERSQYIANEFQTSRDFDKWGLTIAGAALGISVTFIKDVVQLDGAQSIGLLASAWVAMVVAVGCFLAALMCGLSAHRRFRECLDEAASAGLDAQTFARASKEQEKCQTAPWASRLRWIGLVLTLLGLVILLVFVGVNLKGSQDVKGQEPQTSTPGEESTEASCTQASQGTTVVAARRPGIPGRRGVRHSEVTACREAA